MAKQEAEEHIDMGTEEVPQGTGEPKPSSSEGDGAMPPASKAPGAGVHFKVWAWIARHKKVSIPLAAILVAAILAAIPYTRYVLAGTVIRKNFTVVVVDSQSNKPVTSATVVLEGKTATTDSQGRATIHANVGHAKVSVSKKYYQSVSISALVPIGSQKQPLSVPLVATGRQVPVTVKNKLTGKPIANATVLADNTQILTDSNGQATIVLPANDKTVNATITAKSFNKLTATVTVTAAQDPKNVFAVTPAGKIYFLSNASGKIDVVKTDLDGQNRQTALAGTGSEDLRQTVLLASQDWRYLALLSKRDGGDNAKLFLIDTSDDSLTTMDEGDASFTLIGWDGHSFVYRVDRNNKQEWETNAQAIKTYDAASKKLTVLDQTTSSGTGWSDYYHESYGNQYIVNGDVVFSKSIFASTNDKLNGHQAAVLAISADGSNRRTIKSWNPSSSSNDSVFIDMYPYGANSVYFAQQSTDPDHLYAYEDGKVNVENGKKAGDIYNIPYNTYLFSPSNKQTFWTDVRDGKNTLSIGDSAGQNGKQLMAQSDYTAYGWFTDDYLLVSKNGSELYIMSTDGNSGGAPFKIANYYKPSLTYPGYGGGYGGL